MDGLQMKPIDFVVVLLGIVCNIGQHGCALSNPGFLFTGVVCYPQFGFKSTQYLKLKKQHWF